MLQQVCPHCGSALTALATETTPLRCPTCGAALSAADTSEALPIREALIREDDSLISDQDDQEDISATRAVAPEQLEPVMAWAHADHQRLNASASASAPASALTGELPETTQALPRSAMPPEAQEPERPDQSQQSQPGGRRPIAGLRAISLGLAALLLVAIVVVAALAANGVIGAASTVAAPTATVAPTATSAVKPYSPANLYQLRYPQDWTVTQRNSPPSPSTAASYFALLSAPSGNVSVNVAAQQVDPAPASTALDKAFLIKLAKPGTDPVVAGSPTSVIVGHQTWTQLAADETLAPAPGQPTYYAHVIALSTTRGGYAYTIVCVAASPTAAAAGPAFATADQAFFQPLLASFTFLS